jgi:hypothetical protein
VHERGCEPDEQAPERLEDDAATIDARMPPTIVQPAIASATEAEAP